MLCCDDYVFKNVYFHFQEKALTVFCLVYEKAVALGYKLDIIFYQIRIGLFYLDNDLITRNIDKAKTYVQTIVRFLT